MQRLDLDGQPVGIATGDRPFDPTLPCCVLIHGAQNDSFVWAQVARSLAGPEVAVLAPDLPGHGRSGGVALPSIERMADWLVALLEKVGAGGTAPLVLAGHSMGSLIALEAAARAPQRIAHLVMIGTAVPMPVAPMLLDAAAHEPAKAMGLINRWSHSPLAARGAIGGHGIWLPNVALRLMERQPVASLHTDLAACNAYAGGSDAAARLDCPVTIVAGTADRMTPLKAARAWAAALRAATPSASVDLVELSGVGHAMLTEAPAKVTAVLRRASAAVRR
jgi:pimeloyl-ACP methyl ester carboxylesterase